MFKIRYNHVGFNSRNPCCQLRQCPNVQTPQCHNNAVYRPTHSDVREDYSDAAVFPVHRDSHVSDALIGILIFFTSTKEAQIVPSASLLSASVPEVWFNTDVQRTCGDVRVDDGG